MFRKRRKDGADQGCDTSATVRHVSHLGPACLGAIAGVLAGWFLLTRFSVFQPSKTGWGMALCFLVLNVLAGCVGAFLGYVVLGRADETL